MARKLSQSDPALAIEFFLSGFYTHRSQLFAPFKGIGVNVVSFHDPVIDGANMEDTDLYEWSRRPGFSIFCSQPLPDNEIVNQFYSSRDLSGTVIPWVDTNLRWATFNPTAINTIATKTTTAQGYPETIGNITYFSDGAPADLYKYDGARVSTWGLAPPTIEPISSGMGFWQPDKSYKINTSLLDTNGNIESVSSILIPNGAFESPTLISNVALAGSSLNNWATDPLDGGQSITTGYRVLQQGSSVSPGTSTSFTFPNNVTAGDVIILSFGQGNTNAIPTVVSVTDTLGNTYTLQASHTGDFVGGGGNNFYSTEWIYTTTAGSTGPCTVTAQVNITGFGGLQLLAREVVGISATATTSANNFTVNAGSINSGSVSYSGTQFVLSSLLLFSTGPGVTPSGYTQGVSDLSGEWQLYDAYTAGPTPQSPTWGIPAANGQALGQTVVFPLTSITTGYSPYLFMGSFNFNIPAGATILGVLVSIPKRNAAGGTVVDQSVRLVVGGTVVGTNEADGVPWSTSGYSTTLYGGPADTFGVALTPAQVNANGLSGFGVVLSANVTDITGGSVVPEVGDVAPNVPTVTIYFKQASGIGGPGISGLNEPIWPTSIGNVVTDGGLTWTNYGPIQTWFPVTGYPTPVVVLDINGNLQLSTYVANPIPAWDPAVTYTVGQIVYFGGQYWISVFNGSNINVAPTLNYSATGGGFNAPYWSLTTTPLVTGLIAPVWNTNFGGKTVDGSYTWTNIGQGTGLVFIGSTYVYGFRTIYGHLTTSSPFSNNTGAILGPLNGTITSYQVSGNIITFTGDNNFITGNVFEVEGLSVGTFLNNLTFTVISAVPSETFPLTAVQVDGSDNLIITAVNNLVPGQIVTFSGVGAASFLNGVTVTVSPTGLSGTQFEAVFSHTAYGPIDDGGNVTVRGSYTASYNSPDVALTLDSGSALPLISNVVGSGTASPLCNSVASISEVSITANIVTLTASNNFQPGLWVTLTNLTAASFLNNQQFQVIAVDQPIGSQNTFFQVYFVNENYATTPDSGVATFNAIEIYRTSDGGGSYLFDGAVTNPGTGPWSFDDFVADLDLDEELVAPLNHQNDPPPGAPGSSILTTGTLLRYWQGRLWQINGNYVYFDAGPDCTNGIPEESWPPSYRFQFAGPVLSIEPTADGVGLLVLLADRVNEILGGPETISFYATDFVSNFGISNPNAIFRDGSTLGMFTTQKQYFEVVGTAKQEIGEHVADYLTANFVANKTYVAQYRNGLDVGVFLSNGVDQVLRYGSNIGAWSLPAYPACGAGALQSIETSVGIYSLMLASPTGGVTSVLGVVNPSSGTNVDSGTHVTEWLTPENITMGSPTEYATAGFLEDGNSSILRAAKYDFLSLPLTSVVRGVQVQVTGKLSRALDTLTLTITPTNAVAGATSHTFTLNDTNTTVVFGGSNDLWGMPWSQPPVFLAESFGFDIVATATGGGEGPITIGGFTAFDKAENQSGQGTSLTVGPITPAATLEWAIVGNTAGGGYLDMTGFVQLVSPSGEALSLGIMPLATTSPLNVSESVANPGIGWITNTLLFGGASYPIIVNLISMSVSANVVTITTDPQVYPIGTQIVFKGITGSLLGFNGQIATILSNTGTVITVNITTADFSTTTTDGSLLNVPYIQCAVNTSFTPTPPGSVTLPNPVKAGSTILVALMYGDWNATFVTSSVTDTGSNSYMIRDASGPGLGNSEPFGFINLYWTVNAVEGTRTITVDSSSFDYATGVHLAAFELPEAVNSTIFSISEVQVSLTYQNPGNFLYARDVNSWGDAGTFGANNGTPYSKCNVVIGSITMSQLGAPMFPLQHVVGYFDAVGTLNNGAPSQPNIWIMPNEISAKAGIGFIQLPEVVQEPPVGQNHPSESLLALRWPVNMMNSQLASQFVHHLQVNIEFEPENAPNTVKAISFKENQD